jgi:hypothetical protein
MIHTLISILRSKYYAEVLSPKNGIFILRNIDEIRNLPADVHR